MRPSIWRFAVPTVLLAAACGRGSSHTAKVSDDLQRDLAAASSASLELANGSKGYKPMQTVSAIEQGEHALPVQRRPTPRPVVQHHADATPQEQKAPDPAPQNVVDEPKAPEPQQPASEPATTSDAPSVPVVAPRPAPVPVDYPSSGSGNRGGAGPGPGTDIGGVIGVILRGGIGDDHCDPHPRTRPRGRGLPFPFPLQTAPVVRPRMHR